MSSMYTLKIPTRKKMHVKYPDDALIRPEKKKEKEKTMWNVGHFMHLTVAALLT